MKKSLTKNIGLKLLSLLIAIVSWIVIINIQDPLETRKFSQIPVQIINEEMVEERDKIPVTIEGDKVDVVVQGRRSILDSLSEKDFKAIADFSKISFIEAVPIEISLPNYSEEEVEIIRGNDQMMKLVLDNYVKKSFTFVIRTEGEAAPGFFIGDASVSPNVIQISGAEMVINKIKEVVVDVALNGDYSDFTAEATPFVYDMNGDLMDTSNLALSVEKVRLTVPILHTKTIYLKVYSVGTLPEGYEMTNMMVAPESITIAGTKEDLAKISQNYKLEIDVTGLTGLIEKSINLERLLEEQSPSVKVVGEENVAITLEIQPCEVKEFTLKLDDVVLQNIPEGYTAEILSPTESVIHVTGRQTALKDLELSTLESGH